MNEVEKLYENCGIKKQYCGWLDMGDLDTNVQYVRCATKEEYDDCVSLSRGNLLQTKPNRDYPPFTAEKQLELIKWLATYLNRFDFRCAKTKEDKYMCWCIFNKNKTCYKGINKEFDKALAGLICEFWQSLTEEERNSIKEILNG